MRGGYVASLVDSGVQDFEATGKPPRSIAPVQGVTDKRSAPDGNSRLFRGCNLFTDIREFQTGHDDSQDRP